MDHPFRSAAFGGFNRQDVLTYLENLSREEQQQREALQQELDQARETVTRQEGELNELSMDFLFSVFRFQFSVSQYTNALLPLRIVFAPLRSVAFRTLSPPPA